MMDQIWPESAQDDVGIRLALALAISASNKGCMPFGAALLDRRGVIVGLSENTKSITNPDGRHAEINLLYATEHLICRERRLSLYSNVEPCARCAQRISETALSRVVFGARYCTLPHISNEERAYSSRNVFRPSGIEVVGPICERQALGLFGVEELAGEK